MQWQELTMRKKKEKKQNKTEYQLLSQWTSCGMLCCTSGTCGKACKLHKNPRFG